MKSESNYSNVSISNFSASLFYVLGSITLVTVLVAFYTGTYYLALIPFAFPVVMLAITNFRALYFLLLASIPLSMEYELSSSLSTDLPDEPLMVGLMLLTLFYVLRNPRALPKGFFAHGISIFLLLHLAWIFITSLTSVNIGVSVKLFLSKMWYFTTFGGLTAIVIRTKEDLKTAFWCVYIPLTLLILQVFVRQAYMNFSFEDINKPMWPFFRNHVNYASILNVFFPFIWLARSWYDKGTFKRRLLNFSVLFYILAIYLSYTRTCYLAMLMIIPFFYVVKWKLMKPVLAIVTLAILGLCIYLFSGKTYLNYAPEFSETIYHEDFNKHLSSTFEGKDVSSMERVYRWVAATRMFQDKPLMGFGPKNFYPYYKHYTVSSFETYVSDNPERSTAHNYPLLLLVEQGAIGLLLFIMLTYAIFIYGESIYHRMKRAPDQQVVMTLLIVIAMVYANLMLSDLLESDKVGPFYFIAISLLVAYDIRNRSLKADS